MSKRKGPNYSLLKVNKCPLCGRPLHAIRNRRVSLCSARKETGCTFAISDEKLSKSIAGKNYVPNTVRIAK